MAAPAQPIIRAACQPVAYSQAPRRGGGNRRFSDGAKAAERAVVNRGLGIGYILLTLAGALFSVLQVRLTAHISQNILHETRLRVFDKITHMTLHALDSYGTGRLITRATNDIETINEFYSDVFINLFKDVFLLAGIVAVMFPLDWRLALTSFTGIPLIALIVVSIQRLLKSNFRKMKKIIGEINGFFSET
jgi:ATP-binding cassette subfamily B protein